MAGRLVVVTGISGTGVTQSLQKYSAFCRGVPDVPKVVHTVSVEQHIKPKAQEILQRVQTVGTPSRGEMLQLPREILAELWRQSFQEAAEEVNGLRKAGRDVFLTFHACWYHIRSREYVCICDPEDLKNLGPDLLVTLADDIYDIGDRLSQPGQLFYYERLEPPLLDRIFKLLAALQWRAFETSLSDRLAAAAGCSHFLFAVKHPLKTLADLLSREKACLYLSHPITYARTAWNAADNELNEDVDRLVGDVQTLTRALQQQFVVFEPTAIDELCFRDGDMGKRWPLAGPEQDLLWTRPPGGQADWWQMPEDKHGELGLVRLLKDEIVRQISARDHKLVEQCQALCVFRPFFKGELAKGVSRELRYYDLLRSLDMRDRPAQALHSPTDERYRVVACIEDAMRNLITEEGLQAPECFPGELHRELLGMADETLASLQAGSPAASIGSRVLDSAQKHQVAFHNPSKRHSALDPDTRGLIEETKSRLGSLVRDRVSSCYLDELEEAGSVHVDREEVSASAYAARFSRRYFA